MWEIFVGHSLLRKIFNTNIFPPKVFQLKNFPIYGNTFFYLWFVITHSNAIPLLDNPPFVARDLLSDISKTSFSLSYKHTRNSDQ